jgi:hypothetical protein
MKRFLNQRSLIILLSLFTPVMVLGCGGTDRQSVEGTVTFNGEKVQSGKITFEPIQGTEGPTGGALIKDGTFSIPKERSIYPGTFRVKITATKKTGRKAKDIDGNVFDEELPYIPNKYNKASTLTRKITDGQNKLTFDLTP